MIDDTSATVLSADDDANSILVGESLQRAREAMQLSVQDVADALYITSTYVNLIEKNQFQKLPAAIFTRGYIKSYARLVNLAVDEIMARYSQQTNDAPIESFIRPAVNEYGVSMRRHAIKWAIGITLIVLLLPTLGWWYAHQDNAEIVMTPSNETIMPVAEPVTLLPVPVTSLPIIENSTPAVDAVVSENKEKMTTVDTQTTTPIITNVKTVSDTLQITFTEKCWIQVKDIDGVLLHDAEHQAGENINIGGKSPLYVWVKNAKAVTLLFNGKPVNIVNQDTNGAARLVVGK